MKYLYFMEMGTRGHVIKHGKQSGNAEVKVAMVQRMIAVYAFVFALVQMGQQRKTKAFLFTAFGWMEWKIFIIN